MSKATKIWLITATSFVLIGCMIFAGVMAMLKWDFRKLSTVKYETNNYEFDEEYKNISVKTNTADIVFEPSENGGTSVVCYEQKNSKHSVSVKDGSLVIELDDKTKWYEHIGINFGSAKITVAIPKGEYDAISVKASTGAISLGNVEAKSLDLAVSTGKITVRNMNCSENIAVKVSTGKSFFENINCKSFSSKGTTGDITLKNVIADGLFSVTRNTGDVKIYDCDAGEISIKTSTGNVKGNLLSDKVFIAHSDTGRINVPKTIEGGKCEINIDTGNIDINV